VAIETAHPAKFPEEIQRILAIEPELPPSLEGLEGKAESFLNIENSYETFSHFLKDAY